MLRPTLATMTKFQTHFAEYLRSSLMFGELKLKTYN
jgi:hypothetical protein